MWATPPKWVVTNSRVAVFKVYCYVPIVFKVTDREIFLLFFFALLLDAFQRPSLVFRNYTFAL